MAKAVQAMVERIVEDHDENPGDAGRQRSCRRSNGWPTAVEMCAWAPAPLRPHSWLSSEAIPEGGAPG